MEHGVRVEGYERSLPSNQPKGFLRGERKKLYSLIAYWYKNPKKCGRLKKSYKNHVIKLDILATWLILFICAHLLKHRYLAYF